MSWRNLELREFLTLKRGYDLPESKRQEGQVPVVSSSGITGFHNSAKVEGPGVVTGRYGTLGEVYYIEGEFWPLNTSLYVQDFKGNDRRFVFYFLKYFLRGTSSNKSAVPGVNRNELHARTITVPTDIRTQENIVNILSGYDELIDNNRRRIGLLEQSARLLFKEWFVHLHFPGYEHSEILGGLPRGWRKKPLSEICSDIRSTVDPSSLSPDTTYIGLEHIPRRSITLSEWGEASEVDSKKFLFDEGDILFGKIRPYFHKVGFTLTKGITSSDAIVIRPNNPKHNLYCLFLLSSDEFVSLASKTVREGSKMPRADWKFLAQQQFFLPTDSLIHSFDNIVAPIISQLRTLALQNRQITKARDLLLRRLMKGEIIV